ncbi:MAG: tRNA uridine-5-carboxymethylaminomethyl(34) synthesis GTPase MnmE, partial [Bacteroidales bacterium]|nr:tRNA uridine-5-carboxymethylaminomethyl(34) synthesis GTPase MnmE [Bacteroidales bacterium]
MRSDDIIFAPASGQGGAISIIRVSGEGCLEMLDSIVRLRHGTIAQTPGFSLRFGEIPGLDEVLVSVFRAPRSYTGEDMAEL